MITLSPSSTAIFNGAVWQQSIVLSALINTVLHWVTAGTHAEKLSIRLETRTWVSVVSVHGLLHYITISAKKNNDRLIKELASSHYPIALINQEAVYACTLRVTKFIPCWTIVFCRAQLNSWAAAAVRLAKGFHSVCSHLLQWGTAPWWEGRNGQWIESSVSGVLFCSWMWLTAIENSPIVILQYIAIRTLCHWRAVVNGPMVDSWA